MVQPGGHTADVVPRPSADADDRFAVVDKALRRVRYAQDQLIEMLHVGQDVFGYVPRDLLWHLARELRLPPSTVYGTATFYHHFSFDEPGDHTCTVCTGTACFVEAADSIVDAVADAFDLAPGTTSADRRLTLTTARCLGSCGLAPIVVVDGEPAGRQTPETAIDRVTGALAADADAHSHTGDAAAAPEPVAAADQTGKGGR